MILPDQVFDFNFALARKPGLYLNARATQDSREGGTMDGRSCCLEKHASITRQKLDRLLVPFFGLPIFMNLGGCFFDYDLFDLSVISNQL